MKIYYSLIIAADERFTLMDRFYAWLRIMALSFISSGFMTYINEEFHLWFNENRHFVTGFTVAIIGNIVFGVWKHLKMKTFKWEEMIKKNATMIVLVIATYILLHYLQSVSGDNTLSELFEVFIQVTTLFYPISKAVKNIHIISKGEYPPKFIMEKLYNFEKDGDLKDLFSQPEKKE